RRPGPTLGKLSKFLEGDGRPFGHTPLFYDAQHFAHGFIAYACDTQLLQAVGDRGLAALLSKDYVTGPARERRVRAEHGQRPLHHQVDADAGFTREVVRAQNGLVLRDRAVPVTTDGR